MRLNAYIAHHSDYSRRQADELIEKGRVTVNGRTAILGQQLKGDELVSLNGQLLKPRRYIYLALNKPAGYVSSRRSQGASTVYELLAPEFKHLKTVGRLDKDSSGLLLLTNDGEFAHRMTHPSFAKRKVYEVSLVQALSPKDEKVIEAGVELADGVSQFKLRPLDDTRAHWQVTMEEGRNRQIRRTFAALGNKVRTLKRIEFGPYQLNGLKSGQYKEVAAEGI